MTEPPYGERPYRRRLGKALNTPMADVIAELRRRGHRITPQREMILQEIYTRKGHVTAEELFARIRRQYRGVNISTVYRNLDVLEKLGLVCHVHLGHSVSQYHPAGGSDHQHLVCRSCGRVEEMRLDVLEPARKQLLRKRGFEADLAHFALFGVCRECRKAR